MWDPIIEVRSDPSLDSSRDGRWFVVLAAVIGTLIAACAAVAIVLATPELVRGILSYAVDIVLNLRPELRDQWN